MAKLCTAGTVIAADHTIVHAADVHEVAVPAGVVAPSIKSAARVVPGDTYSADRIALLALAGGTAIVMMP
jgi:hypothetical protein